MNLKFLDIKSQVKFMQIQLVHPVVLCTLVFALLMLAFSFVDPIVGNILQYDQDKIRGGEYWRLLTGNFVHFGLYHTVMNLASVTLIGVCLFTIFPFWVWFGLLVVIPFLDGCGLYLLSYDIEVYRGFSGAVYGLAIVGLILNWKFNPLIASIVLAGLIGKLFYERLPGYDVNFLVDKIGVPVAVDAHLWGGVSGLLLSMPLWWSLKEYRVAAKGEKV